MSVTPIDLMTDAKLFASRFGGPTFATWRALVATAWGLSHTLDLDDFALVQQLTGRTLLPTHPVRELWMVIGRRGGKSLIAALLAVFLACVQKYRLAAGERGVVMVMAADRKQGRVVKRYIAALLRSVPMLARLIDKETRESIQLTNGIDIEIHTSSYRAVRGYTVVGAILDELAFWESDEDSANPDVEVLNALRPAMATVPNALLICISSPYARRGELHRMYRDHFGQPSEDVLVVQAPSWAMNPMLSRESGVIAQAYADDPAVADAEYGAQFRTDVESFLAHEVIDRAIVTDRIELEPVPNVTYTAFLDFAGGAGGDSATLAVAHTDTDGLVVVDAVREVKPPFSPDTVCTDFAHLIKGYRLTKATADRWGGQFPVEQMGKHGVTVTPSELTKSDLYRELLPLLNSGTVALLDHPRLRTQLTHLERRTARGGKDSIDHAPRQHDDVANAVAGAVVLAARNKRRQIWDEKRQCFRPDVGITTRSA